MSAFGLRLNAGQWFKAAEVGEQRDDETKFPSSIIVTRSLAQTLFPGINPLGQVVYFGSSRPARIVGIVEHAQTPFASQLRGHAPVDDASFFPFQYLSNDTVYVVRTVPGQLASVMKAAQEKLFQLRPQRVLTEVRTFAQVRHDVLAPSASPASYSASCAAYC